jgi:hypothetical protein
MIALGNAPIASMKLGTQDVSRVMLGAGEVWSSFSPLSLSPALWLDASDASTLYDATSGGSLVAPDGAVARWEDKSGNARHLVQSGGTARPLRKTAIKNGRDVLLFDGVNDCFDSLSIPLPSQILHWFGVFSANNKLVYHNIYDALAPGIMLWLRSGNSLELNTGSGTTSPSGYVETWICAATRTANANPGHRIQINGTVVATNTALKSFSSPQTFSFFNRSAGSTYKGFFAEQLWFTQSLTDSEIDSVNSYLTQKWAI